MTNKEARKYKIAFFGTPAFAEIILNELFESEIIPALIITSPPRKKGRGMELKKSEVHEWAEKNKTDVLTPEKIDDEFIVDLRNTEWDLFIVASYGKILPKKLIDIPKKGTLNVHPSMLPKCRGATPLQSLILRDEPENAGVTIIKMDEEVDHGDIVAQSKIHLDEWPITTGEIMEISAREGGNLLAEIIPFWMQGEITEEAQDHSQATFTDKIEKTDTEIDFGDNPYKNFLKIKAFSPSPLAYFFTDKKGKQIRVKVTDAEYDREKEDLYIKKVIPEGKPEMDYEDFLKNR